MKLNYNILWFEDVRQSFNTKKAFVKAIVEELGFDFPEPRNEINGDNIDQIKFHIYDLIIVDLKLSNDKGSELMERIRRKDVYTEVVFYSSDGEDAVRAALKELQIDGAYCAGRANDDFEKKVRQVILTTIKKVQDVNNTRGLVIGETILLEKKMEMILLKYFSVSDSTDLGQEKLDLLNKIREKKITLQTSECEKVYRIDFYNMKALIDNDILTANNCCDALQSILKEKRRILNIEYGLPTTISSRKLEIVSQKTEIETLKLKLSNFITEIIKIRNTLAHVEEKIDTDGIPYLESISEDGTVIKFDNQKYIDIRSDLIKHNGNLDTILSNIS